MFVGHKDVELNVNGQEQAERLRDRLAAERIDFIYSSDLKRAWLTAQVIASRHQLEVVACSELREINYGSCDGFTFEEIKRSYPDVAGLCADWSLELEFPDGESVAQLTERVSRFLDRLKQHAPEQTVLIVSHGGPLRLLICSLLGIELRHWRQIRLDLASLSIVDTYPEIAILSLLNDTSHLR
jgi:alpha-ribazole phosphatase